jgi:hypothetical protein
MAESTSTSAAPRGRKWLRILVWVSGILILLVVVAWFVVTSSGFLKAMVLPRVGEALNAKVTASDIALKPFSQIVLKDLKIEPAGREALFSAPEITVRYRLMDILRGNYNVELIAVEGPTIQMVQQPDGSSNLDPVLEAQAEEEPEEPAPGGTDEPMKLDLKRLTVKNGTLRWVKLYEGDHRDVAEVKDLNLTVENVRNDFTGTADVSGVLQMQSNPPEVEGRGLLQGTLAGKYSFSLTRDLAPAAVQGGSRVLLTRAEGMFEGMGNSGANLNVEITPVEIKQVSLQFQRGQTNLGELRVSGPFELAKQEGKLVVQLLGVDKKLLDVAGAPMGLTFGPTTITSSNSVQIANAGDLLTIAGDFNLTQFQVTRTNQTTPPIDLHADYSVTVDQAGSNAVLRSLTVVGTQNGQPLLKGDLSSPMAISWGNPTNAVGDSAFNLVLTGLNLADWKPFVGDVAPQGVVSGKAQLVSKNAGQLLDFDANSRIENLVVMADTNRIEQLTATFQAKGQAVNLEQYSIPNYEFTLAQRNQPVISAAGGLTYNMTNEAANVQFAGQMMLAPLQGMMPVEDLALTAGQADFKLRVIQTNAVQHVSGNFALKNLTGTYAGSTLSNYQSTVDLNITASEQEIQIHKLSGMVAQNNTPGGDFAVSGKYNRVNETAQISSRLSNFNQHGVGPFIEPMLTGQKLVSLALNGVADIQTTTNNASVIRADLSVTNLVVQAADSRTPQPALSAGLQADAVLLNDITELRRVMLALTPTARATNQVLLTGKIDLSDTNAMQGSLKLHADALDLTRYYDLFMGDTPTATTASSPAPPATASATPQPETEPEAIDLPVRNFTAEATVGRLYLRELEITNLALGMKVDGGVMAIKPAQLSLNGAPVTGAVNLNLGIPGWDYAFEFSALEVPLAPMVNSFMPEEKGTVGGHLSARAVVKGKGITGPSLRQHLSGNFSGGATNLNFAVPQVENRLLRSVVHVIGILPELKRNPNVAVGAIVGNLLGRPGSQSGGFLDDIAAAPIQIISASGAMGSGKVNIVQSTIQSQAFVAGTQGSVELAPVLTNSQINFPLSIALQRSLAEKINFVPAGTPTNVAYVSLPNYVTLQGTMGEPKPAYNYAALAGTALEQFGGTIPGVDDKTGHLIQGLGGLLGGRRPATGPTNVPPAQTNTAPAPQRNLLQGLQNILNAPAATNAPAVTNAPATNQTNSAGTNAPRSATGLLNQLLNPK